MLRLEYVIHVGCPVCGDEDCVRHRAVVAFAQDVTVAAGAATVVLLMSLIATIARAL